MICAMKKHENKQTVECFSLSKRLLLMQILMELRNVRFFDLKC